MLSTGFERGKNRARPVIVSLLPGDEIEFRAKGTRTAYRVYLGHAFRLAQALSMEEIYRDKVKAYQIKKKAGQRAVKPRRPMIPFNKIYFDATSTA